MCWQMSSAAAHCRPGFIAESIGPAAAIAAVLQADGCADGAQIVTVQAEVIGGDGRAEMECQRLDTGGRGRPVSRGQPVPGLEAL